MSILVSLFVGTPSPRPAEFHLRDPEILETGHLIRLLGELSIDPETRITLARAGLGSIVLTRPSMETVAPGPIGRSPFGPVEDQIRAAGFEMGADIDYLLRLASKESGLDQYARAPTSTAAGLFQFTENTWLCALRKYGRQIGVSSSIRRSVSGRCAVDDSRERRLLLSLRFDTTTSTRMASLLTRTHYYRLQAEFGRRPGASELYALHFFGEDKGIAFLHALATAPEVTGADWAPQAARANPSIFQYRGKALTLRGVASKLRL